MVANAGIFLMKSFAESLFKSNILLLDCIGTNFIVTPPYKLLRKISTASLVSTFEAPFFVTSTQVYK